MPPPQAEPTAPPPTAPRPIFIIKRKKAGHAGRHGGAWKVAYADFVTAMMALFIVLWLMSADEKVKEAISAFFNNPTGPGRIIEEGADRLFDFFIGAHQPQHDKQRHHGGDEIGVGHLPCATVAARMTRLFPLDDEDGPRRGRRRRGGFGLRRRHGLCRLGARRRGCRGGRATATAATFHLLKS